MSTFHLELVNRILPVLVAPNLPGIAAGTDPNGIAGYWNGADPAKAVTPGTNPDPVTVLVMTQVIDMVNNTALYGYDIPLTSSVTKAMYGNIGTELAAISAVITAVATAFTTYAATLP